MTKPIAAIVFSGGMDSTTLAAMYQDGGYDLLLVTVDYGQRHKREIDSARAVASYYHAEHIVVDATGVGKFLTGSALTSGDVDVPEGHYTAPTMTATVVPNRNAILANIAVGAAVARKADVVALGVHAGDHAVYPDCRPEFIDALRNMVEFATGDLWDGTVEAPFVHWTKADIAKAGAELAAPLFLTWSCYKGGDRHCGKCGTCVERAEAFAEGGVEDPTDYEDPDYWRTATTAGA